MAKKKKVVQDSVQELSTKEQLRDTIQKAIELSHELMLEDRSTTLRIKNVVSKLKDSLKVIC